MATSKTSKSTKRPSKTVSAKVAKPSAKKAKASAKVDPSKSIKGFPGQDEHFYKKFPRYAAYTILCSAPKRTMKVKAFLDKLEKLDGVANRKQAMGIVQKLVDKKRHVGAVCASLV